MEPRIRNYGITEDPPAPAVPAPETTLAPAAPPAAPATPATPAEAIPIVVKIDDAFHGRIGEVADRLRQAGMNIPEVWIHNHLDRISGSIEADRLEALRGVEGVDQVERARTYGFA